MDSKICTHVFENPHLGADFVPFMNKTTLFSETHLSICVLSSGPRVAFAGAKTRGGDPFFRGDDDVLVAVKGRSRRRRRRPAERNEEDDDAHEVVLGVAVLLIIEFLCSFFSSRFGLKIGAFFASRPEEKNVNV